MRHWPTGPLTCVGLVGDLFAGLPPTSVPGMLSLYPAFYCLRSLEGERETSGFGFIVHILLFPNQKRKY